MLNDGCDSSPVGQFGFSQVSRPPFVANLTLSVIEMLYKEGSGVVRQ